MSPVQRRRRRFFRPSWPITGGCRPCADKRERRKRRLHCATVSGRLRTRCLTWSRDKARRYISGRKAAQDVLIAVGRLGRLIGTRPNLQKEGLHPPPMLTYNWAAAAYDGTAEFRIAAALACLHAQAAKEPKGSSPGASGEGSGLRGRPRRVMPMRCHLAPLDPERGTEWDPAAGGAMAVWGHGSLVSNLCAVAQRRLIEQTRRALADKPFATVIGVGGEDIAAFLDAGPGFDDRVGNLLAGLVWVRWPGWEERKVLYERWKTRPGALLLTYAALKPLFTPDAALRRLNPESAGEFCAADTAGVAGPAHGRPGRRCGAARHDAGAQLRPADPVRPRAASIPRQRRPPVARRINDSGAAGGGPVTAYAAPILPKRKLPMPLDLEPLRECPPSAAAGRIAARSRKAVPADRFPQSWAGNLSRASG